MKKRITFIALAVILFVVAIAVLPKDKGADEIDRTVQKYAPMGASIAIIEQGQIKEIRNYGYANKKEKKPVTDDTKFKIASISKTVTSYAVMQLVEAGKLDLDAPVNQYLTRWQIPKSEYNEEKVTLRRLMSHTAGLTGSDENNYTTPLPTIDEALALHDVRLKREPGKQFEYSEFVGHGICQLVIEEVTGMKFEDYMVEQVFEPLGMQETDYSDTSNTKGELAVPYAGTGCATPVTPIVMNGGGGVTTTSHDLALFGIALMDYYDNGCGEMFRVQENTLSEGGYYGLGIIPRKLSDGRTVYEHNGTLTGWNAQLVIEPQTKSGIAVVTNSDKAYYMTYELMEVWSKLTLGEKVSDSLMAKVRQVFTGIQAVLLLCILLFGIILVSKIRKQKLIRVKNPVRISACIMIFVLCCICDVILFYKDWIFKWIWGMENYYLFTFFPPEFKYIQLEAGALLCLFLIRVCHTRKKIAS